jgi:hypothetical protein
MLEIKETAKLPCHLKHVLNAALFKDVHNDIKDHGWFMNNASTGGSEVKFWTQKRNDRPIVERVSDIVKRKCESLTNKKLNHIRTHYNGQTFGQNGHFHNDYHLPDFYTFILYCNPLWDLLWGGETVVLTPEKEFRVFQVIPNCGVLFPSNWEHLGKGPSRETYELRITLAFSFCTDEHLHKVKDGKILPEFLEQENKEKLD